MRRVVILALLALALPIAAWADEIDLTNEYGTINASIHGITSSNSLLMSYNSITAPHAGALGRVNFGTGAFSGTSLDKDGTFSSAGSYFDIIGNGRLGTHKGWIFEGEFVGPITWTVTSAPGKDNLTFTLTGDIQGMLWTGQEVSGSTTQYLYSTGQQLDKDIGHIRMGATKLTSPEPGTLGLLGTGLVGIAGICRRKKIV